MGWGAAAEGAGPVSQFASGYPDMADLARQMKATGVRPGIWTRPTLTTEKRAEAWRLPAAGGRTGGDPITIDPSIPEALAYIGESIATIRGWGYELIKHDYSTFDLTGRWGFAMGPDLTDRGWHFHDRSKTTAEIVLDLYRTIRKSAGAAAVIGCNTIGHLAAGLVEAQRIGEDVYKRQIRRSRPTSHDWPARVSSGSRCGDCRGFPSPRTTQGLVVFTRSVAAARHRQSLSLIHIFQVGLQNTRNQVVMQVQQARIGIIQGKSQVEAAQEAVRLAQLTLDGEHKKLEVGISTSYNVVLRERDLVTAQYAEVQALDAYVKALVALDQATGTTLDRNGIQLNDALSGTVSEKPVSPFHSDAPHPPQGANRLSLIHI